jgi:hypothetical protein
MLVIGGSGNDNAAWTAWPPPGVTPFELTRLAWATLDETGWSVQSDSINLSNANATITREDGTDLPVIVNELAAYYGSQWAISMIPSGWEAEPGWTYNVHIEADGGVIDYQVDLVDCDILGMMSFLLYSYSKRRTFRSTVSRFIHKRISRSS